MNNIPHDLSYAYPLKAVFENLFGKKAWIKLKENSNLKDWKHESKRLLKAIEISINENVKIYDDNWKQEVGNILDLGRSHIESVRRIDDLFAALTATFVRLSFLQVGYLPSRVGRDDITLHPKYWGFNGFRSVQYVQTDEQKQALEECLKNKKSTSS